MKHRSLRTQREFGLIVGTIFVLIGSWWLYRGKFPDVAQMSIGLGVVMVMLGLILPRALIYPNRAWMLLAEGLSFVSTYIVLSIVYYLIITPIGLIKRLFGWDPLNRRSAPQGTYWRAYSGRQGDSRYYEKMY